MMKVNLIFILSFFVFNESPNNLKNGIFDNNPFGNVEVCLELFNKEKKHIKYEHDKHLVLPCEFGYKRISKFLNCAIQLANEGNKEALDVAKKIYRDMADGMLYGEVNLNMRLVYEIVRKTLKELNNNDVFLEISLWFIEANICSYEMYKADGVVDFSTLDFPYQNYSFQLYSHLVLARMEKGFANSYRDKVNKYVDTRPKNLDKKEYNCMKDVVAFIYSNLKEDVLEGKISLE